MRIDIEIGEDDDAYLWAKKQSDSVNAIGHIGTHIDCYTRIPCTNKFNLPVSVIDCSKNMPKLKDLTGINIKSKVLILYTGVLGKYGYGSREYSRANTFLDEHVLDYILSLSPSYILIDACGIGNHGKEHIKFDKKCEGHNCFVIENILLDNDIIKKIKGVEIKVDTQSLSTGKKCEVKAIF